MEVTIDGRQLTLERPVTVLEAARLAGVEIPTLCWHPRVSVLGACRLCMVEIEGMNRMLAACTTRVTDKMAVKTDTPALRKVRQTILELLLCKHPMDCPTCVKGGACELQTLTYKWSAPENRFPENLPAYPPLNVSPFIERDRDKCVLCRRCVRVCHEVRGVTVLGAMHRGHLKEVGTYFAEPLDRDFRDPYNCEFCGSCIDICPVGALNARPHKFRARSWEGDRVHGVCPFCSVGCALELQVKENQLVRSTPRPGVNNEDQACFRGRFAVDHANSGERVLAPMIRRDGRLVPVGLPEAAAALAARIRPETPALTLVSASLPQEEIAAVADLARRLFPRGAVRAVCTQGLNAADVPAELGARPWADLERADLIVVAGQDFTPSHPVAGVRIRVARSRGGGALAVLDARDTLLGSEAGLWMRPAGMHLAAVIGGLVRVLAEEHAGRLAGPADPGLAAAVDPEAVEAAAGLEAGSIRALAGQVAAAKAPMFVTHRGWHDPSGQVPRLLAELDRLLGGGEARGIFYLRTDCNGRGAAALAGADPEPDAAPELVLAFGADPAGTALPGTPFEAAVRGAGFLVVADAFLTPTALRADLVLPLRTFAEKSGTFVAGNGVAQRFQAALRAPENVPTLGDTLTAVATALGVPLAAAGEEPAAAAAAKPEAPTLPPPAGGPRLVLRRTLLADHRVRLVPEAGGVLRGPALEVNPGDLASFGLRGGGKARLVSGGAELTVEVRSDWRTPRGQLYLAYDPDGAALEAFARAAAAAPGCPAGTIAISSVEPAAGEGAAR